jgi:hypothetical protein
MGLHGPTASGTGARILDGEDGSGHALPRSRAAAQGHDTERRMPSRRSGLPAARSALEFRQPFRSAGANSPATAPSISFAFVPSRSNASNSRVSRTRIRFALDPVRSLPVDHGRRRRTRSRSPRLRCAASMHGQPRRAQREAGVRQKRHRVGDFFCMFILDFQPGRILPPSVIDGDASLPPSLELWRTVARNDERRRCSADELGIWLKSNTCEEPLRRKSADPVPCIRR